MKFKATVRKTTTGYTKEGKELYSAKITNKKLKKFINKKVDVEVVK